MASSSAKKAVQGQGMATITSTVPVHEHHGLDTCFYLAQDAHSANKRLGMLYYLTDLVTSCFRDLLSRKSVPKRAATWIVRPQVDGTSDCGQVSCQGDGGDSDDLEEGQCLCQNVHGQLNIQHWCWPLHNLQAHHWSDVIASYPAESSQGNCIFLVKLLAG